MYIKYIQMATHFNARKISKFKLNPLFGFSHWDELIAIFLHPYCGTGPLNMIREYAMPAWFKRWITRTRHVEKLFSKS